LEASYSEYCTAIFNLALGVTCDLSAELYLLVELNVTCDQPKLSADNIFWDAFALQGRKFIFNYFVTFRGSGEQLCDTVTLAKFQLSAGVCDL
jgi:hypothetical protein